MDTVARGCAQWQDVLTWVSEGLRRPMGGYSRVLLDDRSALRADPGLWLVGQPVGDVGGVAGVGEWAQLAQLARMAAVRGVQVSAQGLDGRFSEASASYLRAVLAAAVRQAVRQAVRWCSRRW